MTHASAPTPGEAEAAKPVKPVKPVKPWFRIRKRSESRQATRRFTAFFLTLFVMLTGAVGVAVPAGADSPTDGIVFYGEPSTGDSPETLGGYTMEPFGPDGAEQYQPVFSVPAPGGNILEFDSVMFVDNASDLVGGGWDKGGFSGRVYIRAGSQRPVTLTLPEGTRAFHFHAQDNNCGDLSVQATANDGTTSDWTATINNCRATYMGLYATGSASLQSITVTPDSFDSAVMVGDFGIAYAPEEGQVVVNKTVANWGGDPAAAGSFGYTLTDSTAATVVTDSVTPGTDKSHDLGAGTYTLAETATTGWSSSVSCTNPAGGEPTTGGGFSIAPGQTTTCTITNTAQPATVTVTGVVTAGPSRLSVRLPICELYAFQVTVDGTAQRPIPFQTDRKTGKCKPSKPITLQPGATFNVTQVPTLGSPLSRQSYSAGCDGTAAAGGSYACTITNTLGASKR